MVVASHNRAEYLRGCLEALVAQDAPAGSFEVIVVDNASTDETYFLGQEFASLYPNFKVISEERLGVSHARNSGWRIASGSFVAFVDDDAKPTASWARYAIAHASAPGASLAFGGPYDSFYLTRPPSWFRNAYGSWHPRGEPRPFKLGECLCGTNMIVAKAILEQLGGFASHMGPVGEKRFFAEDTDLHLRLVAAGISVMYYPDMLVLHLVKPRSFIVSNLLRDAYQAGVNASQIGLHGASLLEAAFRVLAVTILAPLILLRGFSWHWQNWALDLGQPFLRRWGYLVGLLRLRSQKD